MGVKDLTTRQIQERLDKISQYSVRELRDELARRNKILANKPEPTPISKVDWSHVHRLCVGDVEDLVEGCSTGEIAYDIYEKAMEAVFGEEVWDWINEVQDYEGVR